MGAWGHGLLESDEALDVVGEVAGNALTDLHRLGKAGPTARNTLLACGCLGLIALFGADYFDPQSEIVLDDSPTRARLIRAAVAVYETAVGGLTQRLSARGEEARSGARPGVRTIQRSDI